MLKHSFKLQFLLLIIIFCFQSYSFMNIPVKAQEDGGPQEYDLDGARAYLEGIKKQLEGYREGLSKAYMELESQATQVRTQINDEAQTLRTKALTEIDAAEQVEIGNLNAEVDKERKELDKLGTDLQAFEEHVRWVENEINRLEMEEAAKQQPADGRNDSAQLPVDNGAAGSNQGIIIDPGGGPSGVSAGE